VILGSESFQQLEPIEFGQHQIEDEEVVDALARALEAVTAIADSVNNVAFLLQATLDESGDTFFVFDDQDSDDAPRPIASWESMGGRLSGAS
jgi:hypothetical protein